MCRIRGDFVDGQAGFKSNSNNLDIQGASSPPFSEAVKEYSNFCVGKKSSQIKKKQADADLRFISSENEIPKKRKINTPGYMHTTLGERTVHRDTL